MKLGDGRHEFLQDDPPSAWSAEVLGDTLTPFGGEPYTWDEERHRYVRPGPGPEQEQTLDPQPSLVFLLITSPPPPDPITGTWTAA